jgi:hypothetical protein
MAKQTVKQAAKEVPAAVKAKGAAIAAKEEGTSIEPVLSSKALSMNIGPMVLNWARERIQDEDALQSLQTALQDKEYNLMSAVTMGIVKVMEVEKKSPPDLNICTVVAADSKIKAQKEALNNVFFKAFGLKETRLIGKEGKQKSRFMWTEQASELFQPTRNDDQSVRDKKNTLRSNFVKLLSKCEQSALAIIEKKIKMELDKKAGTLLLSGPAIQARYGQSSVLLNEKQSQPSVDKKGNVGLPVKLKAKPSFTDIGRIAMEARGKTLGTRAQSRANQIIEAPSLDPAVAVKQMCTSFVKFLQKLPGELTDDMRKQLESVESALAEVLSA